MNLLNLLLATLLLQSQFVTGTEALKDVFVEEREAEPDLEKNPKTSLKNVYQEFIAKGGTIYRLEGDAKPFTFLPGDVVFPSCSAGKNRSQTLWNLLRPYNGIITVMPPHATRYGFDPYNDCLNIHRYPDTHTVPEDDMFYAWSGTHRSARFGWSCYEKYLNKEELTPEELKEMKAFYNRNYFNPAPFKDKRRIYITFDLNAHVHLARLSESNDSLKNVIVLYFPLKDFINHPKTEWNTQRHSLKTYQEFSKILEKHLDFTKLVNVQQK